MMCTVASPTKLGSSTSVAADKAAAGLRKSVESIRTARKSVDKDTRTRKGIHIEQFVNVDSLHRQYYTFHHAFSGSQAETLAKKSLSSDSERLMVAFTDAYSREKPTDKNQTADIRVAPSALELLDVDNSKEKEDKRLVSRSVQTPLFQNTLAVAERNLASMPEELPTDVPHIDELSRRQWLYPPNPRLTYPVACSGHPHYLSSKLPINSGPFAIQAIGSHNPYGISRTRRRLSPFVDTDYGVTVPRSTPGHLMGWTSRTPSALALSSDDRLLYGSPRNYWTEGFM